MIRSLVAPDKPRTKIYKQVEDALKSHFEPKPLLLRLTPWMLLPIVVLDAAVKSFIVGEV